MDEKRFKGDQDIGFVYQIKGIEFLPEGFLELDPLLFKDEYEFKNKYHEDLFREE